MAQLRLITLIFLFLSLGTMAGWFLSQDRNYWYVRPVTGEYGTEDGTSYDNAYDGFADINWALVEPNDIIYCIGYFNNEVLTVGASGTLGNPITIKGVGCTIDGAGSQLYCMNIDDYDYITIEKIHFTRPTDSGLICQGNAQNIIGINLISDFSGNQAYQHLDSAQATYYYPQGNNCVDDGLSLHGAARVSSFYGSYDNNAQGVNSVSHAEVTLYYCNIDDNTQYGIFPTDTNIYRVYNTTVTGGTTTFISTGFARTYMYDSYITGGSTQCMKVYTDSYYYGYNCTISGAPQGISLETRADMILESCRVNNNTNKGIDIVSVSDTSCRLTMNKCVIEDYMYFNEGYIEANYSKFLGNDAQPIMDAYNQSQYNINYCTFANIQPTKAGLVTRAGTTANVRNTVFYGSGTKQGTGITGIATTNSTNCIFSNLNIGIQRAGGTQTSTNDCVYSNNTNTSGTITITGQVTGDPKFVTPGSNFALQAGSSCINTGADLGATYINGLKSTSTWTTGIILLSQASYGAGWEIGAYVYEP